MDKSKTTKRSTVRQLSRQGADPTSLAVDSLERGRDRWHGSGVTQGSRLVAELSHRVLLAVLSISLAIPLCLCIWTLDRGFDITDEAYAILLAVNPRAFKIFVSAAGWPTSYLWAATGTLTAYRGAGLTLMLSCSSLLGVGSLRAAEACGLSFTSRNAAKVTVILAAMVVALHFDTYNISVFFTPSYNLLTITNSYAAMGLVFLTAGTRSVALRSSLMFAAGACLGVAFLCKFPTGVIMFGLALLVTALLWERWVDRAVGAAAIVLGMICAVLLLAMAQMPLGQVADNFRLGLGLYKTALPEPITARVMRNLQELASAWSGMFRAFIAPLAAFVTYVFVPSSIVAWVGVGLLAVILFSGGYLLADTDLIVGMQGHLGTQVKSLMALLMAGCLVAFAGRKLSARQAGLFMTLLVMPYAIAAGTSNDLAPQILVSLASWGILLVLAAQASDLEGTRRMVGMAISALFVVTSAAHVSTAVFSGAYHLQHELALQSYPVSVGDVGVIRVDAQELAFIHAMDSSAARCHIVSGTPFLGFYNMPGVAVVLRVEPVLTPWLISASQASPWLAAAPTDIIRRAVVGVQLTSEGKLPPIPPEVVGFPSRYQLCGEGLFPYRTQRIQIWAPQ